METKPDNKPRAGTFPPPKPQQPRPGPRVDPKDPVEEASVESFPASDAPARPQPSREGPRRPAGEKAKPDS